MKFLFLLTLIFILTPMAWSDEADSGLYYSAEKAFTKPTHVEVRLGAGYDFSNPYLNIYDFQASVFYLIDPSISVGLEGTYYLWSQRGSAQNLQQQLGKFGYVLNALTPDYKTTVAVRFTPITGLMNLLSTTVVKADISLLVHGGVVQYDTVSLGQVYGAGLEVRLGFTPSIGVFANMYFDEEKPGSTDWQSRTGFMVGPSFRF